MRHALVGLSLLIPLLSTTGCIAPLFIEMFKDPMGRHDSLTRVQREYTNSLRWGNLENAVQFVHPEEQEAFHTKVQQFREIRVTDYEAGKIVWGDEEQATATVTVTYRAYSLANMVEKEIRETQRWERLTKKNDWVVRPEIAELIDSVAGM
jgi:hypothetical protein